MAWSTKSGQGGHALLQDPALLVDNAFVLQTFLVGAELIIALALLKGLIA
jgi:hypothetical protein